jgi:hypothetical protein
VRRDRSERPAFRGCRSRSASLFGWRSWRFVGGTPTPRSVDGTSTCPNERTCRNAGSPSEPKRGGCCRAPGAIGAVFIPWISLVRQDIGAGAERERHGPAERWKNAGAFRRIVDIIPARTRNASSAYSICVMTGPIPVMTPGKRCVIPTAIKNDRRHGSLFGAPPPPTRRAGIILWAGWYQPFKGSALVL